MKNIKRIHIVGIYGTGKSTLAKKLSKKLKIEWYDLDEIKYKRKYDLIRSLEERLTIVKKISQKSSWITEGAWTSYAISLYQKADLVIFLQIPEPKIYMRILKRHFKRKSDKNAYEKHTFMSTLHIMRQVWRYYHNPKHFMTLKSHTFYVNTHARKYIVLRTTREIDLFLSRIETSDMFL